MSRTCCAIVLSIWFCTVLRAQTAPRSGATNAAVNPTVADNEALKQITQRDQAVRTPSNVKSTITETDADRRQLVRAMVDHNELHTAIDFRNAALVFQHGSTPDDYLLAHTLAVIGASKGDRVALWLSAATLDRYLQSIRQPQIYGTQFSRKPSSGAWTMEPLNPALLPDSLRQETATPTLEQQKKVLDKMSSDPNGRGLLK